MSSSQTDTVALTARTEYLTPAARLALRAAPVCAVAAPLALVILRVAGVSGIVTAAVTLILLGAALGLSAAGRVLGRRAVVLGVDDDSVFVGSESHGIVGYALSDVRQVSPATRVAESSDMTGRDLRIAGHDAVEITFASASGDPTSDVWRVPVTENDTASKLVVARLRGRAPFRAAWVVGDDRAASSATRQDESARRPDGPRVSDAGSDEAAERLWEDATRRHDKILQGYGVYEMQPEVMMRFPAVTDITRDEVQSFHQALDEATALRTDRYPGTRARADAYQQAVNALRSAWIRCETTGRAAGTDFLDPAAKDDLDTARKLYAHAQSSAIPTEQATYYGRVRDIVTALTDRGALRPPEPAIAEIVAATRRAIEAGPGPQS